MFQANSVLDMIKQDNRSSKVYKVDQEQAIVQDINNANATRKLSIK